MNKKNANVTQNPTDNMFYPDHGRTLARTSVLWRAIIHIKNHDFPCQIRNLSFGGLKIQLDLPFKNGVIGIVDIPKYQLQLRAQIAWHSDKFFGLKFLDDHKLVREQFSEGAAIVGVDAAWLMEKLK